MILKGTGDNLGSGSRPAIDQDDDRQTVGAVALGCIPALGIILVPAPGRDNLSALQEEVGHADGLVEKAARVVAQIKNETFQLVSQLFLDLGDRLLQTGGGLFGEGGN